MLILNICFCRVPVLRKRRRAENPMPASRQKQFLSTGANRSRRASLQFNTATCSSQFIPITRPSISPFTAPIFSGNQVIVSAVFRSCLMLRGSATMNRTTPLLERQYMQSSLESKTIQGTFHCTCLADNRLASVTLVPSGADFYSGMAATTSSWSYKPSTTA